MHGPVCVAWAFHEPFVIATGSEVTKRALITLNLLKSQNAYKNIHSVFGERAAGQGILTECDHDIWQRKRAMLNPAFNRKYLMNLMPAFNSICDKFIERIGKFADGDIAVDIAEEFSRVTLDIIGKVSCKLVRPSSNLTSGCNIHTYIHFIIRTLSYL
jgi:cholesterol 24(S)-hydroxylase